LVCSCPRSNFFFPIPIKFLPVWLILLPWSGGSRFFWNVSTYLPIYIVHRQVRTCFV
jgi:hypothetical protein